MRLSTFRMAAMFLFVVIGMAALHTPTVAATSPIVAYLPEAIQFKNGATMVPVMPLLQYWKCTYSAERKTMTLTVTRNPKVFICTVDSTSATDNGTGITLPQAPFLLGTTLYVPVEPFAKALGGTATINATAKTIALGMSAASPITLKIVTRFDSLDQLTNLGTELYSMDFDKPGATRLTYNTVDETSFPAFATGGFNLVALHDNGVYYRSTGSPMETPLISDANPPTAKSYTYVSAQYNLKSPNMPAAVFCRTKPGAPDEFGTAQFMGATKVIGQGREAIFSNDGAFIAFVSNAQPGKVSILNSTGAITELGEGAHPRVSPDNTMVLATRTTTNANGDEVTGLVVYVIATKNAYAPTANDANKSEHGGVFSPDSKKIVYNKDNGIWIMNADRSGATQLTQNGTDTQAAFSPDGLTVYFLRGAALMSIPATGGNAVAVPVNNLSISEMTIAGGRILLHATEATK